MPEHMDYDGIEDLVLSRARLAAVLTHAIAERRHDFAPCDMSAPDGPVCFCGQPSAMESGLCAGAALLARAVLEGVDAVVS